MMVYCLVGVLCFWKETWELVFAMIRAMKERACPFLKVVDDGEDNGENVVNA